jgi:transposase-like protein
MKCIFCKGNCVKNGLDRKFSQRFKCQECKKTFTKDTQKKLLEVKDKRVVIHLILAGYGADEIAECLGLRVYTISKWKKLHLKGLSEILPPKPLLYLDSLIRIYKGIEKSKISRLHLRR